jgi:hypothetical protein
MDQKEDPADNGSVMLGEKRENAVVRSEGGMQGLEEGKGLGEQPIFRLPHVTMHPVEGAQIVQRPPDADRDTRPLRLPDILPCRTVKRRPFVGFEHGEVGRVPEGRAGPFEA